MKTIISIILLLYLISDSISQNYDPYKFNCTVVNNNSLFSSPYIGGQLKPESVDRYTSDPAATFPVLVVFAQFLNDPGPDASYWHSGSYPAYLNQVISPFKQNNPNWWDAYNGYWLSDYWMEVSRGHQHIVGQAVSVILPYDVAHYQSYGSAGFTHALEDLYIALSNNQNINWLNYDKWSKDNNGVFQYNQPDGCVDMMYLVFRSNPDGINMIPGQTPMPACTHGTDHVIYSNGLQQIKIRASYDAQGSGFHISPGFGGTSGNGYFMYAPMDAWSTSSFTEHEHGHYLFGIRDFAFLGGHQQYGKVNNYHGLEEFLSPAEFLRMGYGTSNTVNFGLNASFSIGDYSSRDNNSQAQIIEVPINGTSEYYLIVNRQKVSDYDKIMWGDTAHDNPYRNVNADYGKGIYIYHADPAAVSGEHYAWQIPFDQECADGLYNWVQQGYQHPDWSCTQDVEYYVKSSVVYNMNDNGGEVPDQLSNHDGKSIYNWFGLGKKEYPLCQYGDGTDRLVTNSSDVWTSREWKGDRYDAWKVGYNQVFSPYSSPSTVDWNNNNTGIYIYLESQNGTTANFKIYKVGQGYTEDQILELTPPSRPMGLSLSLTTCNNGQAYPKLTWYQNKEPDMVNRDGNKMYGILKAWTSDINTVPTNYYLVSYAYAPANADYVEFIDYQNIISCSGLGGNDHYARYKVMAYDVDQNNSVPSDFVSTLSLYTWWLPWHKGQENNATPEKFSLYQNYPNPFNPSTQIKYDLPIGSKVTIKVYDVLGSEVAILIDNEQREAGSYTVQLDGTNLASGVYVYSITAGTFRDSKKMVLIK